MGQPNGRNSRDPGAWMAVEALMARVRQAPGDFRTVAALAAAAGLDMASLEGLFLLHVHKPCALFLEEARVGAARRMLLDHFGPPDQAGEVCGFPSRASFRSRFRRCTGMAPGRYQALGREGASFLLELPPGYRREDVLAYHGRDPLSLTERVQGSTLLKALSFENQTILVEMEFREGAARIRVRSQGPIHPHLMGTIHQRVVRMLGLGLDPAPFEGFLQGDPGFLALVSARPGLRIPLTADVWESLVWAILGQQVNLAFAYTLRRRITALCGSALAPGLWTHPSPSAVAKLTPSELLPLQFSRSKAEYLVQAARDVAGGALALEDLPQGAATRAEAELSARRGIGPWTTHYVLMRGCGFADCLPLGDAGLTAALQRHFRLDHRPGIPETALLMAPFAPHRSLATFHLWASLKGVPA